MAAPPEHPPHVTPPNTPLSGGQPQSIHRRDDMSVADLLDRLLETGVVVEAHLQLGIAGVDLVYIGLNALVCSYDRAQELRSDKVRDHRREKAKALGQNTGAEPQTEDGDEKKDGNDYA